MKKILYILNVTQRVNSFSEAAMLASFKLGLDFHIAGCWGYKNDEERHKDEEKYGIHIHQIDYIRFPFNPKNIKAYKQLCALMEKEKFDFMHCTTPIGGVTGRLAARKYHTEKVLYQARGFHFFKGAPLIYNMLFYPTEKLFARYSDAIVTINNEDFQNAKSFKPRKKDGIYYVHGAGIRTERFAHEEKNDKIRTELNIADDIPLVATAGDLIKRKNYATMLKAFADVKKAHLLICGDGPERGNLVKLAQKLKIEDRVHFLGFRTDVADIYGASDAFLFTTTQEGLPRATMEAMASGLPCVVSAIRGNVDLIEEGVNGALCSVFDSNAYAERLNEILSDSALREKMRSNNIERIKQFSLPVVSEEIAEIYKEVFEL